MICKILVYLKFKNVFVKVPHKILLREIHDHRAMNEVFVKGHNKELPQRTERLIIGYHYCLCLVQFY